MYDGPLSEKMTYLAGRHEQLRKLCTYEWTDKAIGNYFGVAASAVRKYRDLHHL